MLPSSPSALPAATSPASPASGHADIPASATSSATSEVNAPGDDHDGQHDGRGAPLPLLRVSRPRFWVYLFGPFLVGLLAGARDPSALLDPRALMFGAYFLFPANLFVYGINDCHDHETDARNQKKSLYEVRLGRAAHRRLLFWAWAATLPFAIASLALAPARASLALFLFLFLSHQYSAPPIRAKARPFIDSAFNLLYACPAFFGYALVGGHGFSLALIGASWCWVAAMHAYSAVPDIEADQEAGVPTVATALGARPAIGLCAALFALAAIASWSALGWLSPVLGALYLGVMALSLRASALHGSPGIMKLYRFFPILNTFAGFLLFWRVAWLKFAPHILDALAPLHSSN